MGSMPPKYRSPMEKDAHPELDTSDPLKEDGIKRYQSLIGALQWCVTLGRFDIACAVMTMSCFRAAPNKNHLSMLGRIIGYLRHTKQAAIRFRTGVPEFSSKEPDYDWDMSVYNGVEEDIPDDIPVPKGKHIVMSTYVDATLLFCRATGRSVLDILHMMNNTPVDWFTKK